MIDNNSYRLNVGIIICNSNCQILLAKRYNQHSWQFPQGGINPKESPKEAMYRELFEEVGLNYTDVKILAYRKKWTYYKLPKYLVRWNLKPICIGQKQRWFLLKLTANENNINVKKNKTPEFDSWKWVNYKYPIKQVVFFKRKVYKKIIKEFLPIILSLQNINNTYQ